jgi:hypothetical protein
MQELLRGLKIVSTYVVMMENAQDLTSIKKMEHVDFGIVIFMKSVMLRNFFN